MWWRTGSTPSSRRPCSAKPGGARMWRIGGGRMRQCFVGNNTAEADQTVYNLKADNYVLVATSPICGFTQIGNEHVASTD